MKFRVKPAKFNKTHLKIIGIIILLLALPLTLILVRQIQDQRTSAAAPDKLEAEAGVLTSSGVTKQTDLGASGGSYVLFNKASVSNAPTPTSPPNSGKIYGSAIAMDTKNNTNIGVIPKMSVSFRASTTSKIESVAWQLRLGEGYSLGDCGIAKITIENADENGKPLGTVLGSLVYDVPCLSTGGLLVRNIFPTSSRANIEAGKLYAVVWENIHSDPANNFWALNKNLAWDTSPNIPGHQGHYAYHFSNNAWRYLSRDSVGFDVGFENGQYDGIAYHNTMLNVATTSIASGNNMLRERITVEGSNKIATGIYVRASKLYGTSPLTIGVYEGSTLLRSIVVPNSDIIFWDPSDPNDFGWKNTGDWEGGSFSPLTLESGKTYYVRLSTNSDTKYHSIGIFHTQDNSTDGSSYPLRTRLNGEAFREGVFEKSTNAGSSWSQVYPYTPGNMQMYFILQ